MKYLRKCKIFFTLSLVMVLASCGGQGSTTVGNPSVTGTVSSANGMLLLGATVYVPDVSGNSADSVTASCVGHGGAISCETPPENSCAATCSCSDGTYELNLEQCSDGVDVVRFCKNDICSEANLNCGNNGNCTLNLQQPSAALIGGSYSISLSKNTCFGSDASDADELWIYVNGNALLELELVDDNNAPEPIQFFDGQVIEFQLENINHVATADCQLSFSGQIASGSCQAIANSNSCSLYYEKCSDTAGVVCPQIP